MQFSGIKLTDCMKHVAQDEKEELEKMFVKVQKQYLPKFIKNLL